MLEAEGAEALKAAARARAQRAAPGAPLAHPGSERPARLPARGHLHEPRSTSSTATERYVYYATLVSTAVALVLFLAPAAHHRLRFREGDKDHILRKGNREAIAGTVASSLAFTGVLYLVTERIFGTPEAIRRVGRFLRLHGLALVELRAPPHGARRASAQRL